MKNSAYLSASYQHDGAGRILARLLSDGAQTQYTWNASQLTGIKTITANGTVLNTTTYTRDRTGNVLTQIDASGTTTYTYDANYQLKTADYPDFLPALGSVSGFGQSLFARWVSLATNECAR